MSLASGVGITSGINYNDIITKLRQVNSRPILLLQQQEQRIAYQRAALESVNKLLLDFKSKVDALSQRDSLLSTLSSSTDPSVVTANAGGGAATGSYSVRVLQLAQAQRLAAQGVATLDQTSIAADVGTLSFHVGSGAVTTIDLTAGMTLQELRDAINGAQGSGVRASIVNDGSPTSPYRLVLTAKDSGGANAIVFDSNDTTLNFATATIEDAVADVANSFNGTVASSGTYTGATNKNIVLQVTTAGGIGAARYKVSYDGGLTWTADDALTTSTSAVDVTGASAEGVNVAFSDSASPVNFAVGDRFTIDVFVPELQKAQDAVVQVDGVQIVRSTNVFKDVIEGITLTAHKADAVAQTITISNDTSGVETKIKAFADAYNKLVDEIARQTKFDTENRVAAPLFGDVGVNGLLASIRARVTSVFHGFPTYSTLSSIGLTIDGNAHLNVDAAKLSAALANDADAVTKLFVESGTSTSSAVQYVDSSDDTQAGTYLVNVTQAATRASLTGAQAIGPGGLAADERLTISFGESAAIQVNLAAGQSLASIVAQLNAAFGENALDLAAEDDGSGRLAIHSTKYGSEQTLGIFSNQDAAAADQLGFGATQQTASGLDVIATVNGVAVTGSGQTLTLEGGDGKGLVLLVTANEPLTASLLVSRGIGIGIQRYIAQQTEGDHGLFKTRGDGYDKRLKEYDKRIETLQARLDTEEELLRKKFTALETKLATLTSQGNFLLTQLSSLIATSQSS
jgi:flagellar hook-associated protein 2